MDFDENSSSFKLLTVVHIKYAGIFIGVFGMICVTSLFGAGVSFFTWRIHETAVDIIAMIGFSIFLFLGLVVHYLILHGINYTKSRFLLPSIIFHVFVIALSLVTALIAVGELVSDQESDTDDRSDRLAQALLLVLPTTALMQCAVVAIIIRLRVYLQKKARFFRHGGRPPVSQVMRFGRGIFTNKVESSTTSGANAAPESGAAQEPRADPAAAPPEDPDQPGPSSRQTTPAEAILGQKPRKITRAHTVEIPPV